MSRGLMSACTFCFAYPFAFAQRMNLPYDHQASIRSLASVVVLNALDEICDILRP